MKIRNRLIMAFVIIIGLPILLISAAAGTIMYYTVNNVSKYYDVETNTTQILMNPNYFVIDAIDELHAELKNVIETSPDKLLETEYLKSINTKLEKRSSFLVVIKEDGLVYVGDEERFNDIKAHIWNISRYSTQNDSGIYIDASQPYLIRKTDFSFLDGADGSVYIATSLEAFLPQVKKSCINLILCTIGIICFTAIFLIVWLYEGMVRPLAVLKTGIYKMKNGDLDFEMKGDTDDEIGRICDDFEDMRKQVKMLMEERIEYEEQMKVLISNISHDLKTPITAIKGYTEGILDGVADSPEKLDKYLKTIYTKANDMSYLVDELSFYSKIDTNKIPYNFVKVKLAQYFEDCMSDLMLDLEVKNIVLEYENHVEQDVEVLIDVEQLKRVINNITGNSVKYMDKKKGIIKVTLDKIEDKIQVTFEDNGKGVAKSELSKIFERFYRTDQSRNSSKGGSGLGLAIAKKIIMDHGGTIWAEGEEGKGIRIFFTLRIAMGIEEEAIYRTEEEGNKVRSKIKN